MTLNIAHTLTETAEKEGEKTALIEAKTNRRLSFHELHGLSNAYARYLVARGVSVGDRVMLMVKPSADFICLAFALFKVGAPVILIDPGMGYANLLRSIAGVRPKIFIGIPRAHIFRTAFPKAFRSVEKSFCCGFSCGLFGDDIRRAAGRGGTDFEIYAPAKDDLAAIVFTTGSTGPPKGVRYEHGVFAAQLRLIRDYYAISSEEVDQPAFPLFALFSTALGACVVLPDMDAARPARVNPERFVRSIQENRVTYSFGSPALWNVVSRYCVERGIVLSGIRQILMAGAPVSGELVARTASVLREDARIHTPYGATESLPVASIEGKEILDETWPQTKKAAGTCVGGPLPGIDIRILPISDAIMGGRDLKDELPPGEIGEIIVRGDVVTRAYENHDEETAFAKIRDGETFWRRTGDTGYIDDIGRLWLCGRCGHRVISRRGVFFPLPCESVTNNHPCVFRSALVGIPDEHDAGLKIPALVIERKKSCRTGAEELLRELWRLVRASHMGDAVEHILFHPDFPVDIRHNAKIFREKLAVWAEKELREEKMNAALVTGGGGFVGRAVVRSLLERGVACSVVGRKRCPALEKRGVRCLQGDIRDAEFLAASCRNVDTVFHIAALAGIWGKWSEYYSINVTGAENVLAACRKNGVARLVYTSTPSVVFAGKDICGGDESLPYPKAFHCHYAKTKAMAEKLILAAADSSLKTCAIRPHLVWGPEDPHLIPRIIERGRKKQLYIIGAGSNLADISYIDNVARAHLLAAENLAGTGTASGMAYFISQGEPVRLWDWINTLLTALGIAPVVKKTPFPLAYGAGLLLETGHRFLRPDKEPRMTRFLAEQLAMSHYFSTERARKDLGYTPLVSTEEGMERLLEWLHNSGAADAAKRES